MIRVYTRACVHFAFCVYFQQKLKEEREAKRQHLDERHIYILQTVADGLGLELSEVEDAILEGTQVCYTNPYNEYDFIFMEYSLGATQFSM